MLIVSTWKTFLTYGLDIVTKEECDSAIFFIATNQVRYDISAYSQTNSQIQPAKIYWSMEVDACLADPNRYRETLKSISSSPSANLGMLLEMNLLVPCFMFVPQFPNNGILVNVLQDHFHEEFGIGSMWLDGAIYDDDPHTLEQDDEKVKAMFKDHIKHARKTHLDVRTTPGEIYRDTRLNTLNQMTETEQRKYLMRNYGTDTDGMDAATVYALMLDLFVDETTGTRTSDSLKDAIRKRYKKSKKK